MKEFLEENLTKVFGYIVATFGAVGTLAASGAFTDLMTSNSIRWTAIVCGLVTTVFGGGTIARGYNNSTKVRVAEAMQTAIQASPGSALPPAVTSLATPPEVKP